MDLSETVAPSFKNLLERLSRLAALFSSKTLRSFNIASTYTKVNQNLGLGNFRTFSQYCRTESKPNLKDGGSKLATKSSASEQNVF